MRIIFDRFRVKPRLPAPVTFEVTAFYAFAISQLGQVKMSGLPKQIYMFLQPLPVLTRILDVLQSICGHPLLYSNAFENAKKLKVKFLSIDLTVKMVRVGGYTIQLGKDLALLSGTPTQKRTSLRTL